MASPSIRPATPSDLDTLAALEVEAGQLFRSVGMPEVAEHDADLEGLRRSQGRGLVWVAEEDGEVAGYVVAALVDGNAHIEQVSVAPAHARRGIGAALIGQVEAWGRSQGAPATTLTTFRDVAWNGPYYARLGYREMSRRADRGRARGDHGPRGVAARDRRRAALRDGQAQRHGRCSGDVRLSGDVRRCHPDPPVGGSGLAREPTGQACGWPMLTIQVMPNRSTHMPNSSPHICFSSGTVTVPPSDSLLQ